MDIDTLIALCVVVGIIAVVVTALGALTQIWSAGVVNRYSKFCPHCCQKIPIAATKCPYCASEVPLNLPSCESSIQAFKNQSRTTAPSKKTPAPSVSQKASEGWGDLR
jgi:hypothetical protein